MTSRTENGIINHIIRSGTAAAKKESDNGMNKYKTIFQPAEILLPAYSADAERMSRWAVIACDQYTSEPDYWESCVNFIDGAPSAYDYILPEA